MTVSHLLRTNVGSVGLPNSANKNTGCSFKFELQINNEECFSTLQLNIAWDILTLKYYSFFIWDSSLNGCPKHYLETLSQVIFKFYL